MKAKKTLRMLINKDRHAYEKGNDQYLTNNNSKNETIHNHLLTIRHPANQSTLLDSKFNNIITNLYASTGTKIDAQNNPKVIWEQETITCDQYSRSFSENLRFIIPCYLTKRNLSTYV